VEPIRYFYSTDGSDVHGPVSTEDLRQLVTNKTIGFSSYVCREGETEWKPVDLPALLQHAVETVAPVPEIPPPFVPTALPVEVALREKRTWADGPMGIALNTLAVIVGVSAAIAAALLSQPAGGNEAQAIGYRLGAFTGAMIVILAIPHIIAKFVKGPGRTLVRCILILGLAFVSVVGHLNEPGIKLLAQADALTAKVKADAQKQLAEKGYVESDTATAEKNLAALKAQATGDDIASRVARDLFNVTDDLMARVKASNEAEKACDFTVGTITSLDDIAKRRTLIVTLRGKQSDVVAYLQDFDNHCREALAPGNFSDETVAGALAGARKSGHVDLLITLWQIQMKLSQDYIDRLDYLQKSFGAWSVKDGKLMFPDDTSLAAFNVYGKELQDDVKQLGDTQKQIFQ
jgi:uncharacterized membrane protein YeaQ/YmgE (transglycosylase-associated protein family)